MSTVHPRTTTTCHASSPGLAQTRALTQTALVLRIALLSVEVRLDALEELFLRPSHTAAVTHTRRVRALARDRRHCPKALAADMLEYEERDIRKIQPCRRRLLLLACAAFAVGVVVAAVDIRARSIARPVRHRMVVLMMAVSCFSTTGASMLMLMAMVSMIMRMVMIGAALPVFIVLLLHYTPGAVALEAILLLQSRLPLAQIVTQRHVRDAELGARWKIMQRLSLIHI